MLLATVCKWPRQKQQCGGFAGLRLRVSAQRGWPALHDGCSCNVTCRGEGLRHVCAQHWACGKPDSNRGPQHEQRHCTHNAAGIISCASGRGKGNSAGADLVVLLSTTFERAQWQEVGAADTCRISLETRRGSLSVRGAYRSATGWYRGALALALASAVKVLLGLGLGSCKVERNMWVRRAYTRAMRMQFATLLDMRVCPCVCMAEGMQRMWCGLVCIDETVRQWLGQHWRNSPPVARGVSHMCGHAINGTQRVGRASLLSGCVNAI
jgi:hypothetical protein